MAAYRAACRDGIDPEAFWRLTPYQTGIAATGLRDGRTILAWQIAALERRKKLPKLEDLLSQKKQQSGAGLIEAIRREKAAHRKKI